MRQPPKIGNCKTFTNFWLAKKLVNIIFALVRPGRNRARGDNGEIDAIIDQSEHVHLYNHRSNHTDKQYSQRRVFFQEKSFVIWRPPLAIPHRLYPH